MLNNFDPADGMASGDLSTLPLLSKALLEGCPGQNWSIEEARDVVSVLLIMAQAKTAYYLAMADRINLENAQLGTLGAGQGGGISIGPQKNKG